MLTEVAELQRLGAALLVVPVRPGRTMVHGELARRVGENSVRLPLMSARILAGAAAASARSPVRVLKVLAEVIARSSWRVLPKNLAVIAKALYVAGVVRDFGAQHIHACWASVPATMAMVVSRITGVPWSFTAHSWDIRENNLLRAKVRGAAFVRAISLIGRDEILKIIGEPAWPTLQTIHVGTAARQSGAKAVVAGAREFSIGCIATLIEIKGHRYLIEACRLLRQRGHRFACHLIGDGPLRARLEAQVRASSLQESVRFHGALAHAQVVEMLRSRAVDVVVLPSIQMPDGAREGIPVSLMEAMAHRIPAISTNTGGIPELLGDGAGVLVEPGDPAGLADAIERVLVGLTLGTRLAEAGMARVCADFNVLTVAERLVGLMQPAARRDAGPEPAVLAEEGPTNPRSCDGAASRG